MSGIAYHNYGSTLSTTTPKCAVDVDNFKIAKRREFLFALASIFAIFICIIGTISWKSRASLHDSRRNSYRDVHRANVYVRSEIKVSSSNEYGLFKAPYPWLEQGEILVEPFKQSLIEVTGLSICDGCSLSWHLTEVNNAGIVISGNQRSLAWPLAPLQKTGQFTMVLNLLDKFGSKIYTSRVTVYSKYVKREIRSLTHEDRERFLDAAATMWNINSVEGKARYGSAFTDIAAYTEAHAKASNDIMCDIFHDGGAFITHHFAIQNSFEASVRAVDPSVTVPYWDFTIEGEQIVTAREKPHYFLQISPIVTADWFGRIDENDHISDSRWAHARIPRATLNGTSKAHEHNSYGLVRSYWNNNNDLEVTRHPFDVCGYEVMARYIPTCNEHYDVLNTASLAAFQMLSPGDGHGHMHVQLGGVTGPCQEAYKNFIERHSDVLTQHLTDNDILEKGYAVDDIRSNYGDYPLQGMLEQVVIGEHYHIYRSLWRSHMFAPKGTKQLLQCPKFCDITRPIEECSCSVPGLEDGSIDWHEAYNCVLFNPVHRDMFNAFFSESFLKDLTITVSNAGVVEGDMVESASPADPLFWMIHPTIERLLAAKRLPGVMKMSDVPFYKWDASNEDWYDYSFYTFKSGTIPTFPEGYTCKGHGRNDAVLESKLPMTPGFVEMADTDGNGEVSNWEYYTATNPSVAHQMDYVFDDFRWSHCSGKIGMQDPYLLNSVKKTFI